MIDQLIGSLKDQAKAAAVKCAVFAVIGAVIVIGAGFLLAAVYMALAASYGAIAAAIALGGSMITLGLVALAIMLQRDPGEAISKASTHADAPTRRDEDDVLFDLLIHAATTGYATGQGDKSRMHTGFEQMVTDLDALGVFDRPAPKADGAPCDTTVDKHDAAADCNSDKDTKMAG